ncbi:Peptidase family M1 domain containing protein [Elaphomyces granulatus]
MASNDRDTLPDVAKPVHYDISLFNLELGGAWTYHGIVKIDLKVISLTGELVLNSKEIEVKSAEISDPKGTLSLKASNISYDKSSERVVFRFQEEIMPADLTLTVSFIGTMNDSMAGFYRSKYKAAASAAPDADTPKDGEFHYMLSTHFEACDARRAIPCFDEPNRKATFDFEIEVPKGLVALSNMPVKAERPGNRPELNFVSFARTPVMSTYLLAWAIGDFEYVEARTERKYNGKSIPVRVYTTRGLKEQARFALECAHRTVDYFSEVFGIDYPLPKSDLLAVHEFAAGAMENWGLVTYRTTTVLFDEGKSDVRCKNCIAYIVAHELAHQWFGNLVTMDWWSELWLNEGFATWVGWLAVDHFYPEWNVWSQLVVESVQNAFQLDSLRASHPIEVPVKNALEIGQIFDHISYRKGSSVIRMLSSHLGQQTFLSGVADYLKAHVYGNATTNDLWSALSKASKQDVSSFMDPWIRKIGFPVVTVTQESDQIGIRQTRFLSTGDVKPQEDETIWWIPLRIRTGSRLASEDHRSLVYKSDAIQGVDDGFYKINKDQSGFYRTNYPPDHLARLGQSLDVLSTEDKIGLVGDAAALAISGDGTTTAVLRFLEAFKEEENYLVWSQISSSLANIRSVFTTDESTTAGLKRFTLKLSSRAAESIGWEPKPDEDYLTGQLRRLLIGMAGNAGHSSIVAEAKRRFQLWASGTDTNAIHPDLRSSVLAIAISDGTRAEYEAVKEAYLQTETVDSKVTYLAALGHSKDPELVNDYLDFIFSDNVAIQDIHIGALSLAANSKIRHLLWKYMKDRWESVSARLSSNNAVFLRFVQMGLSDYTDRWIGEDIESFFKDKDTGPYARGLVVVLDTIRTASRYKERDEQPVHEWLKTHGYV